MTLVCSFKHLKHKLSTVLYNVENLVGTLFWNWVGFQWGSCVFVSLFKVHKSNEVGSLTTWCLQNRSCISWPFKKSKHNKQLDESEESQWPWYALVLSFDKYIEHWLQDSSPPPISEPVQTYDSKLNTWNIITINTVSFLCHPGPT